MVKLLYPLYPAVFSVTLLFYVYLYSPNLRKLKETNNTKHILLWTDPSIYPLPFFGHGFEGFTSRECEYTNCYVSDKTSYLGSVIYYDAIVFNGREISTRKRPPFTTNFHFPRYRSPKQKYVYTNMESPVYFPICDDYLNNFFNWTWTFKLDSDVRLAYFTVYNSTGHIVGPRKDIYWEMDHIDNEIKTNLSSKILAAAWFVSNCKTEGRREEFVKDLEKQLHRHHLLLHIYGVCGIHYCPRNEETMCNRKLENNYYFYLAFENSIAEDYVTEKVMKALNHYTVPIVFGGANYSRFLPPGSYLNARELGPKRLASKMAAIIDNHKNGGSLYQDFFRWRNYYTFKLAADSEDVCNICKLLNDPEALKTSVYENFREWWNGKDVTCK